MHFFPEQFDTFCEVLFRRVQMNIRADKITLNPELCIQLIRICAHQACTVFFTGIISRDDR